MRLIRNPTTIRIQHVYYINYHSKYTFYPSILFIKMRFSPELTWTDVRGDSYFLRPYQDYRITHVVSKI